MGEMILNYINYNFILLILSFLVLLVLTIKPRVSGIDFRPMYLTVYSILLFSVLDWVETEVSDFPEYYAQRMTLSIVCYWLRPAFCLGLIYVIISDRKNRILIAIPELINLIVMGMAWIPGIGRYVFYFDDGFHFQRGPLGYTVFVIGFSYVLILVYLVLFHLRERKAKENLLVVVCSLCIMVATIVEAAGFIRNVMSSLVMVGCLIYYLMIYIQLTSVDALTGLYNRETYYADAKNKGITAIASIDMNGLKVINDRKGHEYGDIALKAIAGAIRNSMNANSRGYRVGGDEFLVIFQNADESMVKEVCDRIRSAVEQSGYSAAIGYAYSGVENVEELARISDQQMYADKEAYYSRKR